MAESLPADADECCEGMEMVALSDPSGTLSSRRQIPSEQPNGLEQDEGPVRRSKRPPLAPLQTSNIPSSPVLADPSYLVRHLAHADDVGYPFSTGYPLGLPRRAKHKPKPKPKIDPHIFEDLHEHSPTHTYPSPEVVRAAREAEREAAREMSWERRWEGRRERDYAREWAWWTDEGVGVGDGIKEKGKGVEEEREKKEDEGASDKDKEGEVEEAKPGKEGGEGVGGEG